MRVSDCPICQRGRPLDVIKDGETVWITAGPEAPLPGYVCVVAKRHVDEPFDLPDNDRAQFWEETMAVAKALAGLLGPKKMNYEIHGNTIAHLHVHVFRGSMAIRSRGVQSTGAKSGSGGRLRTFGCSPRQCAASTELPICASDITNVRVRDGHRTSPCALSFLSSTSAASSCPRSSRASSRSRAGTPVGSMAMERRRFSTSSGSVVRPQPHARRTCVRLSRVAFFKKPEYPKGEVTNGVSEEPLGRCHGYHAHEMGTSRRHRP